MTRRTTGEPLPLQFAPTASRLPERIVPMRPTDGEGPFDDPRYFFEPWWPGIRALVLVEDGAVRLRAEALGDPTAAFPELAGVTELVRSDRVVLDATLMVLDARGRPSRTLLEHRLAGEGGTCSSGSCRHEPRVRRPRRLGPPLPRGHVPRRPALRPASRRARGSAEAVELVPGRARVHRGRHHGRDRPGRARVPGTLRTSAGRAAATRARP
jgi:hypothetical protein